MGAAVQKYDIQPSNLGQYSFAYGKRRAELPAHRCTRAHMVGGKAQSDTAADGQMASFKHVVVVWGFVLPSLLARSAIFMQQLSIHKFYKSVS